MRLEKKHQEELQKRKGLTGRTIAQVLWLLISTGIAYLLLTAIEASGVITYDQLYPILGIPRRISPEVIKWGLVILIVIIMQIFLYIGFVLGSPEGRRRSGQPSLHSLNKDPFDENPY